MSNYSEFSVLVILPINRNVKIYDTKFRGTKKEILWCYANTNKYNFSQIVMQNGTITCNYTFRKPQANL